MALQDALGTVGDPVSRALRSTFGKPNEEATTLTPEQGMQRRIARGAVAEEQLPGLLEGSMSEATKAQADIAKQRTGMAERGKAIGEEFALKERELIELPEYKQKEIPAFEPSQSNLEDIRNVLGLSIVAGFLAGGASKRSGMAAMAALNGAVEGFRQGRQDVYKREIDVFAKNVEAIKENNKQTLERFNRAMGLLQTDRKAAEGELKVLEAEVQNSVAAAALRQGQYKQAQDALFKAVEGSDRASQTMLQLKQQAELKREQIAAQAQARREANQLRIDLAEMRQQQGDLKPGADVNKKYVADNVLLADINDLRADLQKPGLPEKIGKDRLVAFLSEKGPLASQLLQTETDPDVRQFMVKIKAIRNKYYASTSGLAVTSSEAMRNYGVVAQPGDTPEIIKEKLDIMSKNVQDTIGVYRQMFRGLPAIKVSPGMDTGIRQGEKLDPYQTAASVIMQPSPQAGPQEGQEATSKSGKPMVFRNGAWEYK